MYSINLQKEGFLFKTVLITEWRATSVGAWQNQVAINQLLNKFKFDEIADKKRMGIN